MVKMSENQSANENRIVGPIETAGTSSNTTHQPRQPRSLQDLLRYSAEAGSTVDQNSTNAQPLDPDRRRFLEEAISSMTVDIVKEMLEAMKTLATVREPNKSPEEVLECEAALENLSEHVEYIDFSNDFYKIGGFKTITDCLKSDYPSLRWRAADVMANVCQNNPNCQTLSVQNGFLPIFLKMMEMEEDEACRVKALYAVSCIVRESEIGLKSFMSLDGFSSLLRAMQGDIEKLRVKATFLLSSFTHNQEVKDNLCKMGFVEQLVALIQKEHTQSHEHMTAALVSIIRDHPPSQAECRRPELNLQPYLNSLIKEYGNEEAYMEEIQYAEEILRIVFTNDTEEER